MHGGHVVALMSTMPYKMMVVLGGLGVDMGLLLGTSCVVNYVTLSSPMVACSRNCCCLCDMMHDRHVCARD